MNLGLGLDIRSRGPLASYAPSGLLANLLHAYRADLGITLATGVSQWSDLIGTAHLIQSTGANQPAYNATDAGYNSKPTVQSTATNMYLASGAAASTQTFTVWLIGEFSTASGCALGLVPSGSGSPYIGRVGVNVAINAGSALGSGVAANAKHATLATFAGGSSYVGVDNWLTGGVTGAGGANNGTAIAVFAYTNGTFGSVGKFAEIILQAGTPTAGEKTAMAAYVLDRYGITVT